MDVYVITVGEPHEFENVVYVAASEEKAIELAQQIKLNLSPYNSKEIVWVETESGKEWAKSQNLIKYFEDKDHPNWTYVQIQKFELKDE